MIILLAIFGTFFIGLIVFGGGQVFMPLFSSLWTAMGISSTEIENIFAIANATPGVLSTQLAVFTGYLAGEGHWWAWLLMIVAYLVYCLPAIIFVVLATKLVKKTGTNKYLKNLIGVLQPVIVGIVLALVIQLFIATAFPYVVFNGEDYIGSITGDKVDFFGGWRKYVLIPWTIIVPIEVSYLYNKKVKLIHLISIHVAIGFLLFSPWIS